MKKKCEKKTVKTSFKSEVGPTNQFIDFFLFLKVMKISTTTHGQNNQIKHTPSAYIIHTAAINLASFFQENKSHL